MEKQVGSSMMVARSPIATHIIEVRDMSSRPQIAFFFSLVFATVTLLLSLPTKVQTMDTKNSSIPEVVYDLAVSNIQLATNAATNIK
jgi:hypothetical protein